MRARITGMCNRPDGSVWRDDRGQWWLVENVGAPPIGFRGQWSGWIESPISARKARRLVRRGAIANPPERWPIRSQPYPPGVPNPQRDEAQTGRQGNA